MNVIYVSIVFGAEALIGDIVQKSNHTTNRAVFNCVESNQQIALVLHYFTQ